MATYSPFLISRSTPRSACTCSAPISYTFVRPWVLITTPDETRSSRYDSAVVVSTAMLSPARLAALALLVFRLLRSGVVDFHSRLGFQGAQRLVASGDDFVPRLQPFGNFDVSHAGDSGLHGPEKRLTRVHYENALHFILFRVASRGGRRSSQRYGSSLILCLFRGRFQIFPSAHSERLDGNSNHILPFGRRNFRRRR